MIAVRLEGVPRVIKRRLLLILPLAGSVFSILTQAALEPHHVQISIHLSPRPTEGSTRLNDDPYEQRVALQIKLSGLTEDRSNLRVVWMIFYDEVSNSGKIHRKEFGEENLLNVKRGEEKLIRSRDLVLSGKVSRKGQLQGMRYEGYGVRIYEADRLVVEDYQPSDIKADFKRSFERSLKHADELSKNVTPRPPSSETILLFDQSYTAEEVAKILKIVNEKSETELTTEVGLSKPAARNISNNRPFTSLRELIGVSYVKKTALNKLKTYAQNFP